MASSPPAPELPGAPASSQEDDDDVSWSRGYLTFDRRTLGLTRILLGFLLVTDLFRHQPKWFLYYAEDGLFPGRVNYGRGSPWSLFYSFSSHSALVGLFAIMLAVFTCLLVGYRTKLAQIASFVLVTSMSARALVIENGGHWFLHFLLLWTLFLPMGDRLSVDALRASFRARREVSAAELNDRSDPRPEATTPFTSALGAIILVQLAAVYLFNAVQKTGTDWRNLRAVFFTLYTDRLVTPLAALVRDHIPGPIYLVLGFITLTFERTIPVLLFSPLLRSMCRRVAAASIILLHIGFGALLALGPFSWTGCVFATLLFGAEDWGHVAHAMRRSKRARVIVFDPDRAGALAACRLFRRLDGLDLLTFREERGLKGGLAVERGASTVEGPAAVGEIVAALPLGPLFAWAATAPIGASIARAWTAHIAASAPPSAAPADSILERASDALHRFATSARAQSARDLAAVALAVLSTWGALQDIPILKREWAVDAPQLRQYVPIASKVFWNLRLVQGWGMFAPDPISTDVKIVVDAQTADGRHLDPLTGQPPNFNLHDAKSLGYDQMWCDLTKRVRPSEPLQRSLTRYILRYHERTGRPGDRIVAFKMFTVADHNPRWGETESWGERTDLIVAYPPKDAASPRRGPSPEEPAEDGGK